LDIRHKNYQKEKRDIKDVIERTSHSPFPKSSGSLERVYTTVFLPDSTQEQAKERERLHRIVAAEISELTRTGLRGTINAAPESTALPQEPPQQQQVPQDSGIVAILYVTIIKKTDRQTVCK
jgi:hypothetical protein